MATTRRSSRTAAKRAPGIYEDYGDTEYRESEVYDGPQPTRGIYRLELVDVRDHFKDGEDESTSRVWTLRIMDGEEDKHGESVAGWKGRKYTNAQGAKWVEQKLAVALGLIPVGGQLAMSYEQIMKKAKPCRGLIVPERYIPEDGDPEWRASLTSEFLPDDGATRTKAKSRAAEEDEEDPEEDEEPPPSRSRRGRKADPEPEPEEEEGEEGDEDEDERVEATEEDLEAFGEELAELKLPELKAKAKDYGVTVKRGQKADAIIDAILDAAEEDGLLVDDAPEEEEPEEEPEPPKSRSRRSGTSKPAARAGSKRGYDDEPPF